MPYPSGSTVNLAEELMLGPPQTPTLTLYDTRKIQYGHDDNLVAVES